MCFDHNRISDNIWQYCCYLLLVSFFWGFGQDMPGPRLYALFAKDFTQLCRCVQNLEESRVFKPGKKRVKHVWLILVTRVSWICSLAFWTWTYVWKTVGQAGAKAACVISENGQFTPQMSLHSLAA
jgi:hypothetical protein